MSETSEMFSTADKLRRALDAHIAASVDAALERWLSGSNSADPTERVAVVRTPAMPSLERLEGGDDVEHEKERMRIASPRPETRTSGRGIPSSKSASEQTASMRRAAVIAIERNYR